MRISSRAVLCLMVVAMTGAEALECSTGFGSKKKEIPKEWIDDGYCDCPLDDGADEPHTSACSGAAVGGWAGVEGNSEAGPTFQCPQQKALVLPRSRINDGICDCCDGTDEQAGVCQDICDVVLAEETAIEAKKEQDFLIGSEKRLEELQAFRSLKEETVKDIEAVTLKFDNKNRELDDINRQIADKRLAYVDTRRTEVTDLLNASILKSILEPLTDHQLALFIQLTCQFSGELEDTEQTLTCLPLRLAGVELGITWEQEDFLAEDTDFTTHTNAADRRLLSKLIEKNTGGQTLWSIDSVKSNPQKKRRRLTQSDSPIDHDDDYSYYNEGHGDDDYSEGDGDDDYAQPEDDNEEEEKGEIRQLVEATAISVPRMTFLTRSLELKNKIKELLEQNKKLQEETTDGEGEDEEEKAPEFDSTPYENVKEALTKREDSIKRGIKYAVSGNILVKALMQGANETENRARLLMLAGLTLVKSKLGMIHVWQIVNVAVPEFGLTNSQDEQTCASPFAGVCPPKSILKNGAEYPGPIVNAAGAKVCEQAVDDAIITGCDEDATANNELITFLPDGYFGYHMTYPGVQGDALFDLTTKFNEIPPAPTKELMDAKKVIDEEVQDLENQLNALEDMIGGREEKRFGPTGELLTLQDTCHTVTAGKYDYEVCIFGQAQQKDLGQVSGTSLGNWKSFSIDKESGMRVMKWEGGQKCWNGPQRSATVYVTCGAENKLLSADEPDTCRYELHMESHIGCDYQYYQRHLSNTD